MTQAKFHSYQAEIDQLLENLVARAELAQEASKDESWESSNLHRLLTKTGQYVANILTRIKEASQEDNQE